MFCFLILTPFIMSVDKKKKFYFIYFVKCALPKNLSCNDSIAYLSANWLPSEHGCLHIHIGWKVATSSSRIDVRLKVVLTATVLR